MTPGVRIARLSEHFSLAEFETSQEAARLGIPNEASWEVAIALKRTAEGLERIRARLNAPLLISSGYRSPELNAAIGGSANSQHCKGEAADFTAPDFGPPAAIARDLALALDALGIDQLILEFDRWVHVSFTPAPRRQVLTIDRSGTRAGINV